MRLTLNKDKIIKDQIVNRVSETAGLAQQSIKPKSIRSRVKAYTYNVGTRQSSLMWEEPDWDFGLTNRVIDTESFVARAFRIKTNLFLKEGYDFVSSNPERSRYIKNRLRQIGDATDKPFHTLLRETISSLQSHRNAIWVKGRKKSASGGKVRMDGNRQIQPVAGYWLIPIETVQVKRDEYGKLVKIRQIIEGKEPVEFGANDIIHFYLDKRPGMAIGTPPIVPVKDDIRALRRIEENVELLIHQNLIPLLHAKVGDKDYLPQRRPDGSDEITDLEELLAKVPSDGALVTGGHISIDPVESKSGISDIVKIMDFFKKRIYTGLGVSSVDMGEADTSNRSTANQMSRNIIDEIKADQNAFLEQFHHYVISELLLESTFPEKDLFSDENNVTIQFNEIDIESRQAKENHYADLFNKNLFTHDETREAMGKEAFKGKGWVTESAGDGFDRTNYGLFGRDTIVLQSIDEPGTEESKSLSKAAAKQSNENNSISNKNQPSNQHGTRSSAKVNRDKFNVNKIDELKPVFSLTPPLSTSLKDAKKQILKNIKNNNIDKDVIDFIINSAKNTATRDLFAMAKRSFGFGLRSTPSDILDIDILSAFSKIEKHVDNAVIRLALDIKNSIDVIGEDSSILVSNKINIVFDSLMYRSEQIDFSENIRAFNYGVLLGAKASDNIMKIDANLECEECKKQFLKYKNNNDIIYEELPPYHPYCECKGFIA